MGKWAITAIILMIVIGILLTFVGVLIFSTMHIPRNATYELSGSLYNYRVRCDDNGEPFGKRADTEETKWYCIECDGMSEDEYKDYINNQDDYTDYLVSITIKNNSTHKLEGLTMKNCEDLKGKFWVDYRSLSEGSLDLYPGDMITSDLWVRFKTKDLSPEEIDKGLEKFKVSINSVMYYKSPFEPSVAPYVSFNTSIAYDKDFKAKN